MDTIPNEGFPIAAKNEPCCVQAEAGKTIAWCTCGLSEKQPFCDGRHKQIEGMPFKSLKVTFESRRKYGSANVNRPRIRLTAMEAIGI